VIFAEIGYKANSQYFPIMTPVPDDLYTDCFPAIEAYIEKNSGNKQDAEDIFQESLIVLLKKQSEPDFTLTSSVKTYLFSVAKNLWLKKLRKEKQRPLTPQLYDDPTIPELHQEQELSGWFQKITAYCRRVLSAIFLENTPITKLMATMGWKNKHTAAQQKYKCLRQLENASRKQSE
jgi:RNA polymerase sigma factor (sigma-70 family)